MGKAVGDGYDLAAGLRESRFVAREWTRASGWLAEEYESACNLALAEACAKWDPSLMGFRSYCRFLMYRRCRDVYRKNVRVRSGRLQARWLPYHAEWWDIEGAFDKEDERGSQPPWHEDSYAPDDSDWRLRQVLPHIVTLPRLGLASEQAVRRVLLYLEVGSMKEAAEREGVHLTQICHDLAAVARGIKFLKVAV